MRKLALTLLLAASLPAFAATDAATQTTLTTALEMCAAASCKQDALEAALESGLSVKAVLDIALKTSSAVDAVAIVTKAALKKGPTFQMQIFKRLAGRPMLRHR